VFKFSYKLVVINKENIPKSGAIIFCPNHTSNIDSILLAVSTKRRIRFMAKSELFKNKIFAVFLRKLGVFPIKRKTRDESALKIAENILKNNGALGIFLEGTRSKTGELLRPKSGASLLAIKTNSPILPVCIASIVNKGIVRIFRKTVVKFGKIIFPQDIICFNFSKENKKIIQRRILRSNLKLINEAIMFQIKQMKEELQK
jgi:1-acyl-sn-glycerol-3-phosphate acyltransferase